MYFSVGLILGWKDVTGSRKIYGKNSTVRKEEVSLEQEFSEYNSKRKRHKLRRNLKIQVLLKREKNYNTMNGQWTLRNFLVYGPGVEVSNVKSSTFHSGYLDTKFQGERSLRNLCKDPKPTGRETIRVSTGPNYKLVRPLGGCHENSIINSVKLLIKLINFHFCCPRLHQIRMSYTYYFQMT